MEMTVYFALLEENIWNLSSELFDTGSGGWNLLMIREALLIKELFFPRADDYYQRTWVWVIGDWYAFLYYLIEWTIVSAILSDILSLQKTAAWALS